MLSLVLSLLIGCQNPCQQLCERMAQQLEDCGRSVTLEEHQQCQTEWEGVTEGEAAQCQAQTDAAIQQNLRLQGSSDDPCTALKPYQK